jgi:hypothetical protein
MQVLNTFLDKGRGWGGGGVFAFAFAFMSGQKKYLKKINFKTLFLNNPISQNASNKQFLSFNLLVLV